MSYPKIVLFGDSITEQSFDPLVQGHGALLSRDYSRRADVLNRGVGGYTSTWLLPFLETILQVSGNQILLFIILVGTNDACLPGFVHHVPMETFKRNLLQMKNLITQHSNSRMLFITPPPICKEQLSSLGPRNGEDRELKATTEYAEIVRKICKQEKMVYFDLYKEIMDEVQRGHKLEEYFSDGLHLSIKANFVRGGLLKGYHVLYQGIKKTIASNWRDLVPENMKMMRQMPWWPQVPEAIAFGKEQEKALQHDDL